MFFNAHFHTNHPVSTQKSSKVLDFYAQLWYCNDVYFSDNGDIMYGYVLSGWHLPEKDFACTLTENQYYWHPDCRDPSALELSLITGRNVTYTCFGRKYTVTERNAFFCSRHNDGPSGEGIPGQPVHIDTLCIYWPEKDMQHREFTEADYANTDVLLLPCFLSPCPEISRVERLFKQYIHHSVSNTSGSRAMCISLWFELAAVIDQNTRKNRLPARTHTAEYYASKLDNIIERNFCQKLHLEDLASELGVSPNYLSAVYRRQRGQRFSDSLLSKRMEYTRQLLLRGNLSLQDIAEAVGFSSESYLRRQFLRYYGITPTEFLRIERELTLYMDRPIRENMKPNIKNPIE